MPDYFKIPRNWFFNSKDIEDNWEINISIAATKTFMKFAFLNSKKRLYLAFNNYEPNGNVEMAK